MKIRWQYFLGGLLALLGFGGCRGVIDPDDPNNGGSYLCMYGSPHANYKVIGEVKDPSGKPIEGIRVVVTPVSSQPVYKYYNDTLFTDAKGQFQKDLMKYSGTDEFKDGTIQFEDVDGDKNGSFKTKVLKASELEVKQTKKGDGAWYNGDFTITAKTKLEKAD